MSTLPVPSGGNVSNPQPDQMTTFLNLLTPMIQEQMENMVAGNAATPVQNQSNDVQYPTEIHKFQAEIMEDFHPIIRKYPAIFSVTLLFLTYLGFTHIKLSFKDLFFCILYSGAALKLGKAIWNCGGLDYATQSLQSVAEIKNWVMNKKADFFASFTNQTRAEANNTESPEPPPSD